MATYFTQLNSPVGRLLLIGDGTALQGFYYDVHKLRPAIQVNWTENKEPFSEIPNN